MSDLMLEIINWVMLITVIAVCIFLLFIIVYVIYYIMTDETKKELKKYKIYYIINEIKGECYVAAKNKKQAIKEFCRYYVYISDVKEAK